MEKAQCDIGKGKKTKDKERKKNSERKIMAKKEKNEACFF